VDSSFYAFTDVLANSSAHADTDAFTNPPAESLAESVAGAFTKAFADGNSDPSTSAHPNSERWRVCGHAWAKQRSRRCRLREVSRRLRVLAL
jgi:hypothetical protein